MSHISAILTVALVHFLAVVSPGPDFMLITRNSLIYSRKSGIYTALGLGLGILVHVTYCLLGIAIVISKSILLFNIIKYLGAAYLIYIGFKSLTSKASDPSESNSKVEVKDLTPMQAIKSGFITNVTNPKATLFFLSLFTLVIDPNTPFGVKLFMGAEMSVVTFLWFGLVALIFSHSIIKKRVHKIQTIAERFIGGILIALGIKVAFFTNK